MRAGALAAGGLRPPASAATALTLAALLAPVAQAQQPEVGGSSLGGVGLVETRTARFRPDGVLEAGASLRHQRRMWFVSWQALPWLEATYRLTERLDATSGAGMTTDRAADVKIRLVEENDWLPQVAIGLQDFIGTGLHSGEYVVASKRFGPWDVSLGLGWGRLGTAADFGNPLSVFSARAETRPRQVDEGGSINALHFFRGEDTALFGGVEYALPAFDPGFGRIQGLRARFEFSGDALRDERGGYPARTTDLRGEARSRVNYGLAWSNDRLDLSLGWVHGTDLVFRASARLDPDRVSEPRRDPPPAMGARPAAAPNPEAGAMAALREAGFRPVAVRIEGATAGIAVAGGRQRTLAQAAGRVLRAVQPYLPREVERIVLSWRQSGVEVARLVLPRGALEAAALGAGSAEEVFYAAALQAAGSDAFGTMNGGAGFAWGIEPRLQTLLGDPTRTLRWQLSAVAGARLELGHGVALSGSVARSLLGNLGGAPASDSLLPHVRSDAARYAREGETSIPAFHAERIWSAAPDLFARVTAGYLEPMFAGLSAELLWRPHDAPWALGMEIAHVGQRAHDGGLGLLGYSVTTGHVSVHADLPWYGMYGVLRAGRYLAGDWGGTLELGRRFDSGIEIGGFATITDVPFRTFGEGSFDRGIYVRVPLELFGIATRQLGSALIRGVQRDGGQRLAVDSPLWEVTRDGRARALEDGFGGFLR